MLVLGDSGMQLDAVRVAAILDAISQPRLHVGYITIRAANHRTTIRVTSPLGPLLRHTPVWLWPGNHDVANTQASSTRHLPQPLNGTALYFSTTATSPSRRPDTHQTFTRDSIWITADSRQQCPLEVRVLPPPMSASAPTWLVVLPDHPLSPSSMRRLDLVLWSLPHTTQYPIAATTGQRPGTGLHDPVTIYVVTGAGGGTVRPFSCPHTSPPAVASFVRPVGSDS